MRGWERVGESVIADSNFGNENNSQLKHMSFLTLSNNYQETWRDNCLL